MTKKIVFVAILVLSAIGVKAQGNRVDFNETFSGVEEVEVDMVFSDVFIEQSSDNKVHVDAYIEWDGSKKYKIEATQKDTKLIVKLDAAKWKGSGNSKGKMFIKMPVDADASVNTVSGNINITGVGRDYIDCNTVSGDIEANKIACDVDANSVSGDMMFSSIDGDVETDTVSGDVNISSVTGDFEGSSVSGDFTVSDLKGSKDISTLSGEIR